MNNNLQLTIGEATREIMSFLEAKGSLVMGEENLFPIGRDQPRRDQDAVFGNFTGMGIANSPREGREFEYSGTVFFAVHKGGKTFYKCPIQVSIPGYINKELIEEIKAYEAEFKTHDVALQKCELSIKHGAKENAYLSLASASYDLVPAWELDWRPYTDSHATAVYKKVGRTIQKTAGGGMQLVTILWGDGDVYDQAVKIPKSGPIVYENQSYKSLDELCAALLVKPSFMRTFNDMDEQCYRTRAGLLEEFFLTPEFLEYRDDFDGFTPAMVDDAALKVLKIFQPRVQKAPQPPQVIVPSFGFKK